MSTTRAERRAVQVDAKARVAELLAVRDVLLPDADDPEVLSELSVVESELAAALIAARRERGIGA
jgi:hypothetical protein